MPSARDVALAVLNAVDKGTQADAALDKNIQGAALTPQDAAFTAALVYGTLERRYILDYYIKELSKMNFNKLEPSVINILRIGLYQLCYMRVPAHAVCNEAAGQANRRSTGFINAILRNFIRNGVQLPENSMLKYSVEDWIAELLIKDYGLEEAEAILSASFYTNTSTIRVNTLKTTPESLCSELSAQRVEGIPNALEIGISGKITDLPSFKNGLFHVQDAAAQLCCMSIGLKGGETIFDMCAAPGGKSFTLAEMSCDKCKLLAFDLHERNVKRIREGAQRLGLRSIEALTGDASVYNQSMDSAADIVLCDVPCSGLGVIRKKPDIRFKKKEDADALPEIQLKILQNSSRYVRRGGRLIYSTCTLNKAENEKVVEEFLKINKNIYIRLDFSLNIPYNYSDANINNKNVNNIEDNGYMTLFPNRHGTDGFFISVMGRC